MKYLINKIKWYYQYYKYMYLVNKDGRNIEGVPYEFKTFDMGMVAENSCRPELEDHLYEVRSDLIARSCFHNGMEINLDREYWPKCQGISKCHGFTINWV